MKLLLGNLENFLKTLDLMALLLYKTGSWILPQQWIYSHLKTRCHLRTYIFLASSVALWTSVSCRSVFILNGGKYFLQYFSWNSTHIQTFSYNLKAPRNSKATISRRIFPVFFNPPCRYRWTPVFRVLKKKIYNIWW